MPFFYTLKTLVYHVSLLLRSSLLGKFVLNSDSQPEDDPKRLTLRDGSNAQRHSAWGEVATANKQETVLLTSNK